MLRRGEETRRLKGLQIFESSPIALAPQTPMYQAIRSKRKAKLTKLDLTAIIVSLCHGLRAGSWNGFAQTSINWENKKLLVVIFVLL